MGVRGMNDGSPGVVVDAADGEGGGVRVRPLSGGRLELYVLPFPGTLPAVTALSPEDAREWVRELVRLVGAE